MTPNAPSRAALAALIASLAACTPVTKEERIAGYRANCSAYGFAPGSTEMAQCVADEARTERLERATDRAAMARWSQPPVVVRTVVVQDRDRPRRSR